MNDDTLPPELTTLVERLRARRAAPPTDDFRHRVLDAVAGELSSAGADPDDVFPIERLWPIAAAVLIILNLSIIFASQDSFSIGKAKSDAAAIHALNMYEAQQERSLQ